MRYPRTALMVVTLLAITTVVRADVGDYLEDGKLKHSLTLHDEQGGFAGFTGMAWIIEPDGDWKVARLFQGKHKGEPVRTGKLTEKQLAALAYHLDAQKLNKLPKMLGEPPRVNPHRLTLMFGDHTSQLSLPPGAGLTEVTPSGRQAEAVNRFLTLAIIVRHWTQKSPH